MKQSAYIVPVERQAIYPATQKLPPCMPLILHMITQHLLLFWTDTLKITLGNDETILSWFWILIFLVEIWEIHFPGSREQRLQCASYENKPYPCIMYWGKDPPTENERLKEKRPIIV